MLIAGLDKIGIAAVLQKNAAALDDYFRESFENSMVGPALNFSKNPFAIIALGGYGRQEQCVYSDVDLLILFEKSVPVHTEKLVREMIYPLWDIGLDVGHATRTLKECLKLSGDDFEVLTSLLDARFICGMSQLYSKLVEKFFKSVIGRRSSRVITWLVERNFQRHLHYGDSSYLLEPNLKEGQGGLRDFHTMLWISRIQSGLQLPRDLEYFGFLSHNEYALLETAITYVWNVRNRLHRMAKRKCDQLYFENQIELAENMGYSQKNGQMPVEAFLGELHGHMETVKQISKMFLYEQGYDRNLKKRRVKKMAPTPLATAEDFVVSRGTLGFASPEAIPNNPSLLMYIFRESARHQMPLNTESRRLIRDFLYLVDDHFRFDKKINRLFDHVLTTPAPRFNVLNEMLNSGFLARFIPEFRSVENRIQYDEYHLYPVDRHLLRSVQIVKTFGAENDITGDTFCGDLYREVKSKRILLWATLLHDIGKGNSRGNHSQVGADRVPTILANRHFTAKDVDHIRFLVAEHLVLIKTATRRDINDEETSIQLARSIQDEDTLKMLHLLTVADAMATGPKACTQWSMALLKNLFFKISNILKKGELASKGAVQLLEKKRQAVLAADNGNLTNRKELFTFMSPRYLLYSSPADIVKHAALFFRLKDRDFVWEIESDSGSKTRTVTICAKDTPGLFSKLAGMFTLNGMDILDTQVFTWRNNVALDIFKVTPPPDELFEDQKWKQAEKSLGDILSGRIDIDAALHNRLDVSARTQAAPVNRTADKIVVDNDTSSFFTIIEVFTRDFPGLLYRLTSKLVDLRLDIWVAKIATASDQVVDVFYVRDFDGQKVDDPEQVAKITKGLLAQLDGDRNEKS